MEQIRRRGSTQPGYTYVQPKAIFRAEFKLNIFDSILSSGDRNTFSHMQLQSLDISGSKNSDPALVDLLKVAIWIASCLGFWLGSKNNMMVLPFFINQKISFETSQLFSAFFYGQVSFSNASFSVAFPYVSPPEEKVAMESSLISEFADACQHNLQLSNIAFLESCSVEGRNFDRIADVHSVHVNVNNDAINFVALRIFYLIEYCVLYYFDRTTCYLQWIRNLRGEQI